MTDFCETLRERRKSVGLSQRKLAERAGLCIETIRSIERGHTANPYKYTMNAINKAIEEARLSKIRVLTGSEN